MNDRVKIRNAFTELRRLGWFARSRFWCCQTCGCAAVPESAKDKFVFYHKQDADSFNDEGNILPTKHWRKGGDCMYLTHGEGGNATEIVEILNKHGLNVEWNGDMSKRIKVWHKD